MTAPRTACALDWAVREATARGCPLRIVHAFLWPLCNVPLGPVAGGFAGAFLIVVAYERTHGKDWHSALAAGWGTFVGRMAGIVLKLVIAVAMIIAVTVAILF